MSYTVYPVQKYEVECTDYKVYLAGRELPLNTARVSKVPFNRRWPGHQRSVDQTELVSFLSMSASEPLDFEVELPESTKSAVVRPASLGIAPVLSADGKRVSFRLEKPAYFTLEPYGREKTLHFFVDEETVFLPESEHIIRFAPGIHDVGMLRLESNTTILIEAGAVVYGSIRADDADNIRIIGQGILDGSRNKETILFDVADSGNLADVGNAERTHTIHLAYCRHVLIDGITIRDPLMYNISSYGCDDYTVRGVKIIGSWRYNADGIDFHNDTNATVEHCFVRTFDDCICVKGAANDDLMHNGLPYDSARHIRVRDCVLFNDWGKCLEIGAGTRAKEICDVVFENCDIIHVSHPALDALDVHYADVHDVAYRNINIEMEEHVAEPRVQLADHECYRDGGHFGFCLFAAEVACHPEYSKGVDRRGRIHDITVENISVSGSYGPAVWISGYDEEHGCSDITLRNITWNGAKFADPGALKFRNGFHKNIVIE